MHLALPHRVTTLGPNSRCNDVFPQCCSRARRHDEHACLGDLAGAHDSDSGARRVRAFFPLAGPFERARQAMASRSVARNGIKPTIISM